MDLQCHDLSQMHAWHHAHGSLLPPPPRKPDAKTEL